MFFASLRAGTKTEISSVLLGLGNAWLGSRSERVLCQVWAAKAMFTKAITRSALTQDLLMVASQPEALVGYW
jgi:hypothetical protein